MWTKESVISKLHEINRKGFIPIPPNMYRNDDGIVGQVLEREFGIEENNLHIADLGIYELKGMRYKKGNKLTLFHQTSSSGLSPLDIFENYCYEGPSKRDGTLKRKLFTTVNAVRQNKRGFILQTNNSSSFDLYYHDQYLATWDLTTGESKIKRVLLALAETQGAVNSKNERFHYVKGYILSNPKNIYEAIDSGAVVMELCIDQPADRSKAPHDRGPHIRIPIAKLSELYDNVEQVL